MTVPLSILYVENRSKVIAQWCWMVQFKEVKLSSKNTEIFEEPDNINFMYMENMLLGTRTDEPKPAKAYIPLPHIIIRSSGTMGHDTSQAFL